MALAPSSGLTPAWAARPRTVIVKPQGFPGGLQLARPAKSRLQDEGPGRAACQAANERCGIGTTNLLVGVDHDHTLGSRPEAEVFHDLDCVEHLHQAALHVKNARPADSFPVNANRHLAHRADRPDGVAVAHEQLKPRFSAPVSRAGDQRARGHATRGAANGHPGVLQLRR